MTVPLVINPYAFAAPSATTLVTENWTGTNGAAWPAQWTTNAKATIQSNAGRIATAATGFDQVVSKLTAPIAADIDIKIDATIRVTTGTWAQIYFRQNLFFDHGWSLLMDRTGAIQLNDVFAGTTAASSTYTAPSVSGDVVHAHIIATGASITCAVWTNGASEPAPQISYTDTTYPTQTYFALSVNDRTGGAAATWDFDNLIVTTA